MSGKYYTQVIYTKRKKSDPAKELLVVYDADTDGIVHVYKIGNEFDGEWFDYIPQEYLDCKKTLPRRYTWKKRYDILLRLGQELNSVSI